MDQDSEHHFSGKDTRTMKKWLLISALVAVCIVAGTAVGILVQSPATASNAVAGDPAPSGLETSTPTEVAPNAPSPTASSSGCGSSGCGSSGSGQTARRSCCGSGGGQGADSSQRNEQIRAYIADSFTKRLGDGISVEIKDFGCHQEAEVSQNGKLIKRLSINGNSISEIS